MDTTQLGFQIGTGSVLGVITGYAAKKALKLFAVLVGLQLGLLAFLEQRSIVKVRWSAVGQSAIGTGELMQQGTRYFVDAISVMSVGGSFAVGAMVGFKRG